MIKLKRLRTVCYAFAVLLSGLSQAHAQDMLQMTDEQFQSFLDANRGATPEELQEKLRQMNDQSLNAQRTAAKSGYSYASPPRLQFREETILALSGAHKPVPLTLGTGVITAVTFIDAEYGAWPIKTVTYDKNMFSVNGSSCSEDGANSSGFSGNIINIYPCQFWITGKTISVTLEGVSKPLILSVTAGSDEQEPVVDAQLTLRMNDSDSSSSWEMLASRRININPVDNRAGGLTPIYPAVGVITDISFMDSSGNAWPIEEIVYNPQRVSVSGSACAADNRGGSDTSAGSGNVAYISLCRNRKSNISVKLQGAPAALGLLVVPPGDDMAATKPDSTVTATIAGKSPNAPKPEATPNPNGTASGTAMPRTQVDGTGFQPDRYLSDFVNGTPPRGARNVPIRGASNIEGYLYNNQLYIRGPYVPVNPAGDASASSSGGSTNVWRYNQPVRTPITVADITSGYEYNVIAEY